MKRIALLTLLLGFAWDSAWGQGAQADMIKRRAKETANQNNVRQGVPSPAPTPTPAPRPATPAPRPATPAPANKTTAAQSIVNLRADLAGFKTGTVATAEQKQKFIRNLALSARGTKPSLPTVQKFVNSLTTALTGATLTPEQQARLAQNLDAVLNSKPLPATQFDKIIEDTQAILEVGTVKRAVAVNIAAELKAIGAEVRR
jgi:hypothetical protein